MFEVCPRRYLCIFRREIVVTRDNCKYLSNLCQNFYQSLSNIEIFRKMNNKYYLQMTKCNLVEGYLKYIHKDIYVFFIKKL